MKTPNRLRAIGASLLSCIIAVSLPMQALAEAPKTAKRRVVNEYHEVKVEDFFQWLEVHLMDRPGSVQSNIIVAANGIPRNNPDTPELSVVNSVLGGGFSGRLFQNLRERNAFTYGSSSNFDQAKLGGVFAATAEVRNEVTGKAVTEILNELKRIREEAIPAPELDLQKQYVAGNYLLSLENDRRNLERVQDIDLFGLPNDYYQTLIAKIGELHPGEAHSLARKYIPLADVAIIVVGDADQIRKQLEPLGPVTVYDTDLKVKK